MFIAKVEDTSIDRLREPLDDVDDPKATNRLMLGILFKQGPSVPMIAEGYHMRDETIYRWFTEMEDEPQEAAIFDEPPPGRPANPTDAQRQQFKDALLQSPEESGYDQPVWTRPLAERFLEDEFEVTYHERTVRRLMKDLGVSWQSPRS